MKKKLATFGAACAAAGAMTFAAAPHALAYPAPDPASGMTCTSGHACSYTGTYGSGARAQFHSYQYDYRTIPGSFDNNTQSVWNNGNYQTVCFYTGYGYSGSRLPLAVGKAYKNMPSGFVNTISSGRFC